MKFEVLVFAAGCTLPSLYLHSFSSSSLSLLFSITIAPLYCRTPRSSSALLLSPLPLSPLALTAPTALQAAPQDASTCGTSPPAI